jgi:hypothetical protein
VEEAARERAGGAAPAGVVPPAVAGGVRRGGGTAPRLLRALRIQALTESTTKRAVLGGIPWALPDDSLIFFFICSRSSPLLNRCGFRFPPRQAVNTCLFIFEERSTCNSPVVFTVL